MSCVDGRKAADPLTESEVLADGRRRTLTVGYTRPAGRVLTVVVSTGGQVAEVERFAVIAVSAAGRHTAVIGSDSRCSVAGLP